MAREQRFISGIFNYCDRWCERCQYTARCRVYRDTHRMEQRHQRKGQPVGGLEVALKDVARSFEKARRLLERWAKAQNLDLNEMVQAGDEAAHQRAEGDLDEHPLVREATSYMKACGELIKKLGPVFNKARDDAKGRAGFMDVGAEAGELARVREALEVLSWDYTLICVKVRRAVSGLLGPLAEETGSRDASTSDAAGSAFVARKCLIRSKAALTQVYEWDRSRGDEVIDLLVTAERLQRGLEGQLPGCIDFCWPPNEEE
jgi:hypothetical protein